MASLNISMHQLATMASLNISMYLLAMLVSKPNVHIHCANTDESLLSLFKKSYSFSIKGLGEVHFYTLGLQRPMTLCLIEGFLS